jgi:hypothetical protein
MRIIMSWEKLGADVRARRKELRLTQVDVSKRGGPSVETLRAVENTRAGRLTGKLRRALERALQWEPGSIDTILDGGVATPGMPETAAPGEDRFSLARQVVSWKTVITKHSNGIGADARAALVDEITRSAKEAEESIITLLPWLDDVERGEAINLLVELRKPV